MPFGTDIRSQYSNFKDQPLSIEGKSHYTDRKGGVKRFYMIALFEEYPMKKRLLLALRAVDYWLCLHIRPHRLRIWWHRLWIREDEFHPSLCADFRAMWQMNSQQLRSYGDDLARRRDMAHEKDLKQGDAMHRKPAH